MDIYSYTNIMKKLPSLFGFEVIKNEEDGTVEIDVNCTFPEISIECRKLYQAIEIVENPVKLTTTFQSKLTTISGAN